MSSKIITGIFNSHTAAESLVTALMREGFEKTDISVVMTDSMRKRHFALETGTKAAEGAGVGGAIGGAAGAAIAAIAAVGTSLILPGLGLVIAGPIAAGLAGLGAGAATGGLIGALVGAGVPEHRAKAYEAGLKNGGILIGVEPRTNEETERIERMFQSHGAQDVKSERLSEPSEKLTGTGSKK